MATQTYPSPSEREQIVQRRIELFDKLLPKLLAESLAQKEPNLNRLIRKYGQDEVELVLARARKMAGQERIGAEARTYREYRRTFARFGGNRRFLSKPDYEELRQEFSDIFGRREFKSFFPFWGKKPGGREQELRDLLLLHTDFWEDLTPSSAPPRPANFDAPTPADYNQPEDALLEWGWQADESRVKTAAQETEQWRAAAPALARMALDEGLLEGWPGKPASWTPLHALRLLGQVQAAEFAGDLLALLGRQNDWLSDQLPGVWGKMGAAAEPPLWAYLQSSNPVEQRSSVLLGLKSIAQRHPNRREDIIKGLTRLLQRSSLKAAEFNSYIIYILNQMQAKEASGAILSAFERKIVDTQIIRRKDIPFLEK